MQRTPSMPPHRCGPSSRLQHLSHQLSPRSSSSSSTTTGTTAAGVTTEDARLAIEYPGYSPQPLVTADPDVALQHLRAHGAAVFEAAPPHEAARLDSEAMRRLAASVAPTVFGGALALAKAPVTKVEDGAPLRSQPHQDGGQAYGNAVNDYLMLMGDTPAEGGAAGESYLLDAMGILEALPERLQRALRTVHMEQSAETHGFPFGRSVPPCHGSRDSETAAAAKDGRPTLWRSALWRPAAEGEQQHSNGGSSSRPFFRCPTGGGTRVHQHLDHPVAGLPGQERQLGEEATLAFRQGLLHADNAAPRFVLHPGQALLIDNYRMVHGRERFAGARKIWRVWFWSTDYQYANTSEPAWLSSLPPAMVEALVEAVVAGVASEDATQWGEGPGLHPETRAEIAAIYGGGNSDGLPHGLSEQQMDELIVHGFNVRWRRSPGETGL
jgi:alpha-ketoglutarate-dependent taurine dioxygenase